MLTIKPINEVKDYGYQLQNYDNIFIESQFAIVDAEHNDEILFLNSEECCVGAFPTFLSMKDNPNPYAFLVYSITDSDNSLVPSGNNSNGRLDFLNPKDACTFVEKLKSIKERKCKNYWLTVHNPFHQKATYSHFNCFHY